MRAESDGRQAASANSYRPCSHEITTRLLVFADPDYLVSCLNYVADRLGFSSRWLPARAGAVRCHGANWRLSFVARGSLQVDRPRKQDVVFQVDVLVQVGLHALQLLVHRAEGRAGIRGQGVAVGHLAELG